MGGRKVRGNDTLVFDPGNQFSDDLAPPYAVIPSSWRTFLFRILKPRELSLYIYLCSLCDKNSVAYPSIAQIRNDLDISSDTTVTSAIKALEDAGFFMRKRAVLPRQSNGAHQNVYQRPSMHYTMLRLLEMQRIDSNLRPLTDSDTTARRESKAVHMTLKKLLGSGYHRYEMLSGEEERSEYLKTQLRALLETKRDSAKVSFALFQERIAISTVSRLKRAEDQLVAALHDTARNIAAPTPHLTATLSLLPHTLRIQRGQLREAVDRKSVAAVEGWLHNFKREFSRMESEIIAALPVRNGPHGPTKAAWEALTTYAAAPKKLADVLKRPEDPDVPF
ncbi:MAG: helix-turn-helix domain-containing protein [Candidatus Cybelea sp.]